MKFRVKVDDLWYQVEVGDLNARPVEVWVDGERFEVWPEVQGLASPRSDHPVRAPESRAPQASAGGSREAASGEFHSPARQVPKNQSVTAAGNGTLQQVRAPIPGVVVSVAVGPQAHVKPGDPLCVLEAMKMNNVIRAARAGTIAAIHISPGQHVAHREILMEFAQ